MKDKRENKTIQIEFNHEDLDEYLKEYFKVNPRKRKVPIESPMVRSLNKMLVIKNRIVQNTHKQNYKDYAKWVVKKHGFDMLGICSTDLHIELTFPTKIRHDIDNFTSKEVLDGFTDIGLIVDDSYEYVKSITTVARYEKGVTKMIFTFNNCEFDKDKLKIEMAKEKAKKEKREKTMAEKKKKASKKSKK